MNFFNVIVAVDADFGIGKDGKLSWHLPADLKHFKDITTKTRVPGKKNLVIMGRKTWDALPSKFRPLPDRVNCVLSRNEQLSLPEGVWRVENFEHALDLAINGPFAESIEEVFVIGGAQVFDEGVHHPRCHLIYLTQILKEFDCDTFFPKEALSKFKKVSQTPSATEEGLTFSFTEYSRIS